nr:hypothetical protein ACMD2_01380 [Ipomoea batatas]
MLCKCGSNQEVILARFSDSIRTNHPLSPILILIILLLPFLSVSSLARTGLGDFIAGLGFPVPAGASTTLLTISRTSLIVGRDLGFLTKQRICREWLYPVQELLLVLGTIAVQWAPACDELVEEHPVAPHIVLGCEMTGLNIFRRSISHGSNNLEKQRNVVTPMFYVSQHRQKLGIYELNMPRNKEDVRRFEIPEDDLQFRAKRHPNPPSPILVERLKFFVVSFSSVKVNTLRSEGRSDRFGNWLLPRESVLVSEALREADASVTSNSEKPEQEEMPKFDFDIFGSSLFSALQGLKHFISFNELQHHNCNFWLKN